MHEMETFAIVVGVITSLLKTGVFFMVGWSAITVIVWSLRRRTLGELLYRAKPHWTWTVAAGVCFVGFFSASAYFTWWILNEFGFFLPDETELDFLSPPKRVRLSKGLAEPFFCFIAVTWLPAIVFFFGLIRCVFIGHEFGRRGVYPYGFWVVPWKSVARVEWKKSLVLLLDKNGALEQVVEVRKTDRADVDTVLRQCVPLVEEEAAVPSRLRVSSRWRRRKAVPPLILGVVFFSNLAFLLSEARRECDAARKLEEAGAFVRQDGVYVDHVSFERVREPTEEQLRLLTHFHGLNSVSLYETSIDDASMKHIAPLKTLERLDLFCTPITDNGLAALSRLTSLRHLRLIGTNITGDGMRHLEGMNRLRSLDVSATAMTKKGLVSIGKLGQLRELTFTTTPVRDEWLAPLGNLSKLEQLSLSRTQITGAGLRHLEPLSNLRHLSLCETEIDDAGLRSLASLSNLERLWLIDTPINGIGLAPLASLTKLEKLGLGNTRISNAGVDALAQLKSLTYLSLAGAQITDAGVALLASLPNLETLDLSETQITDTGIKTLAKFKNLRDLYLGGTRISDAAAATLARMTHLNSLSLRGTQLSADAVEDIRKALVDTGVYWDDPEAEEWEPPERPPDTEWPAGQGHP